MPKAIDEIKLHERTLPLVPQPWAAIIHDFEDLYARVRDAGGSIEADELNAEKIVAFLGDHAYDALGVFIPKLSDYFAEWQFKGYRSREAMDAGDYAREHDKSPTFPQIIDAFERAFAINGGKRLLGALSKIVDPKAARAEMSLALSEWRERQSGSLSSPGMNGESLRTSSGTDGRTSADPDTSESEEAERSSGIPLSV